MSDLAAWDKNGRPIEVEMITPPTIGLRHVAPTDPLQFGQVKLPRPLGPEREQDLRNLYSRFRPS
jgi:hypothetical protein